MGSSDLSSATQITIGVVVGLVSTSIQSLGLTLQRKSHLLEDDRPQHLTRRPPHRRRRWQIGMLLFIISNVLGSSIQITTLPLVILSPLQASGLVFNSICATLILAEPFTRYSLIGTILVCAGAALIATFGALKEPAHSLDELLQLLKRRAFLLWMCAQGFLVACILCAARASQALFPRAKHNARMRMSRGVAYGCVSGILSAHCLLLAKSAVELLVRTAVDRVNQFNRWQSWIILVGLVSLALTQLFYLHRGLKLCSTSVLYPLVFCVYNIIAILDGLIYYKQASRLSPLHGGLIALGTAVLLSGVLALSWRLQDEGNIATTTTGIIAPGPDLIDDGSDIGDDGSLHDADTLPTTPLRRRLEDDRLLSLTRRQRQALSEAEEIWGELQDDDTPQTPRVPRIAEDGGDSDEAVNETSGLLRKHPTKRKSRRRSSYGFPALRGRTSHNRGSVPVKQEDIGRWWKIGWWRRRRFGGDHGGLPS